MSKLFDALAGVNRRGLNEQVAQAQSENDYRSAEELDAFQKARLTRAQAVAAEARQTAINNAASSLVKLAHMDSDLAPAVATALIDHGPQGLSEYLTNEDKRALFEAATNPTGNPTVDQTHYNLAVLAGVIPRPQATGIASSDAPQFGPQGPTMPGLPTGANMQAMQAAQIAHVRAQTANESAAAAGHAPVDPNTVALLGYELYKGLTPSFGMGGAGLRQQAYGEAARLAGQEQATGQPAANPAFDNIISNNVQFHAHMQGAAAAERNIDQGQFGQRFVRLTTALQHMDLLRNVSLSLHNGDIQGLNRIANFLGVQTGAAPAAEAQLITQAIGNEVMASAVAGGGAESERKAFADKLNAAILSPEQLNATIAGGRGLLAGAANRIISQTAGGLAGQNATPDVLHTTEQGLWDRFDADGSVRNSLFQNTGVAQEGVGHVPNVTPHGPAPTPGGPSPAAAPSAGADSPPAGGAGPPSEQTGNPPRLPNGGPVTPTAGPTGAQQGLSPDEAALVHQFQLPPQAPAVAPVAPGIGVVPGAVPQ